MEHQILTQQANELKAIINGSEKHSCFHIDTVAPEECRNIIMVFPANKYDNTLWNFEKVLAWAELNNFVAMMTITPQNQPAFRLIHADCLAKK